MRVDEPVPRAVGAGRRAEDRAAIVRALAACVGRGGRIASNVAGPLRRLVRAGASGSRGAGGGGCGLDVLGRLLFEALRGEVARRPEVPAAQAVVLAGRLSHGLAVLTERAVRLRREIRRAADPVGSRESSEFTRMLTHELKNPLSAAEAAAQVLADLGEEVPGERQRVMATQIRQRLHRANDLLDAVMALALAESGPVGGRQRRASLRDLLDEIVRDARDSADERDVTIEIEGIVPDVIVDATRIELILYNLILNAVKYSDLTKSDRWVRIAVQRENDGRSWHIRVADNGMGVPGNERGRIFERFYRGADASSDGHGLGLAIVKEAVDQIGGEIRCDSELGTGTTFDFTVPDPLSLSKP